jgi:hypothetical protein
VEQFAAHATPEGVVGLVQVAFGLVSLALGKVEAKRKAKGKA